MYSRYLDLTKNAQLKPCGPDQGTQSILTWPKHPSHLDLTRVLDPFWPVQNTQAIWTWPRNSKLNPSWPEQSTQAIWTWPEYSVHFDLTRTLSQLGPTKVLKLVIRTSYRPHAETSIGVHIGHIDVLKHKPHLIYIYISGFQIFCSFVHQNNVRLVSNWNWTLCDTAQGHPRVIQFKEWL